MSRFYARATIALGPAVKHKHTYTLFDPREEFLSPFCSSSKISQFIFSVFRRHNHSKYLALSHKPLRRKAFWFYLRFYIKWLSTYSFGPSQKPWWPISFWSATQGIATHISHFIIQCSVGQVSHCNTRHVGLSHKPLSHNSFLCCFRLKYSFGQSDKPLPFNTFWFEKWHLVSYPFSDSTFKCLFMFLFKHPTHCLCLTPLNPSLYRIGDNWKWTQTLLKGNICPL